ncbi:MAG: retropepsin-like domain-containing protein [Gemmataceae bacterium]|nr:retropepsin-like domain-containing protein [Gemmataceae bacterium]
MPTITFPATSAYRYLPGLGLQPALDVTLFYGSSRTSAPGLLDTGAQVSVFSLDVAEGLGIQEVARGERTSVRTLGGGLDVYLFDVEMEVRLPKVVRRFPAQVGFFPVVTSRNILGRNLIFAHFLIAFSEGKQEIYFRPDS